MENSEVTASTSKASKDDVANSKMDHRDDTKKKNEEKWDAAKEVPEHEKSWGIFIQTATEQMIKIYLFLLFFCILGSGLLSRILVHIMMWKINPPNRNISHMTTLLGKLVPDSDRSTRNITCTTVSCNGGLPLHWECRETNSRDMCSLAEEIPTVNTAWYWAIMLTISAPYIYSFLTNFSIWCTKPTKGFSVKIFVTGLLKEVIHSFGLCVMVYVVLPIFTPDVAAIVGFYLTVISSMIHIWVRWKMPLDVGDSVPKRKIISRIIAISGFIFLVVSVVLFIVSVSSKRGLKVTLWFLAGMVCLSFDWFEAFIVTEDSNRSSLVDRIRYTISLYIRRRKELESWILLIFKLIFNLVSFVIVFAIQSNNPNETLEMLFSFDTPNKTVEIWTLTGVIQLENTVSIAYGCQYESPFLMMMVTVISTFVFFKLSHHACRITYQMSLFSTPVILVSFSAPWILSVMLLFLDSFIVNGCSVLQPLWTVKMTYDDISNGLLLAAFFSGFISLILVNIHVWRAQTKDLIKARRIFTKMRYSGVFPDVSLLLSRNSKEEIAVQDFSKTIIRIKQRPKIFACATMWHEEYKEMCKLLSSIFTLDRYLVEKQEPEFEFETHIFFDDAFCGEAKNRRLNKYTNDLSNAIQDTMKSCYRNTQSTTNGQNGKNYQYLIEMEDPVKYETPYGLRYEWKLMQSNVSGVQRKTLTVHFKDKDKIRNKKRWSQVMYFYYTLLYKRNDDERKAKEILKNTYILALDGDVEFKPDAVSNLLKGIQRSDDVGACCGRIHPLGSGPMAWYQKFEYASSHWLQKSTEHVAGCVLCSPGCFTLVRGSAIVDDNVLKTYTKDPERAIEHIQFDQGEDRWLCTLLLKTGHRIEYCAAADAYTFAPEGFSEFFMQRRRWTPSTLANIYDIITNWNVAHKNNSITRLFLLYQLFLFVTAIITPGTIFLLMYGAIIKAYEVQTWVAFMVILIPVLFFIISIFIFSGRVQLKIAAMLSGVYGIIMMIVLIGIFKSGIESGWCSDTTLFIILVAGIFFVSALLHPQEFTCILPGILYIFCVPAMSMLLLIYAIGNINVTSWGTREATSAKAKGSRKEASCSVGTLFRCICCPKSHIVPIEEKDSGYPRILRRTPEYLNLKFGDKLRLKVQVTGNPTPLLQWMKDGALLKSSPIWIMRSLPRGRYILKTIHVQSWDAGRYTCTATNENGSVDISWDVSVTNGDTSITPKFKRWSSDQTLYEGDKLILKTHFVGCKTGDVEWYLQPVGENERKKITNNNTDFIIMTKELKSILTKKKITSNDAGVYFCTILGNKDEVKATVKIQEITPVFKQTLSDQTLYEGETLILKTYLAGCKHDVTWYFKRKGEDEKKEINIDDVNCKYSIGRKGSEISLIKKDVTVQDAGEYSCILLNGKHRNTVTATDVTLEDTKKHGCEDSKEKHQNEETNHDETSNNTNENNCELSTEKRSIEVTGHGVPVKNSGEHRDKLSKEKNRDEIKATVHVLENRRDEPRISLVTFKDRTLIVGEDLTMTLRVTGSSDPPIARWLRNGKYLTSKDEDLMTKTHIEVPNEEGMVISRRGTLHKLAIDKVKITDSGRYKFEIINGKGEIVDSKTAIVIIKEKIENMSKSHVSELEKLELESKAIGQEEKFWYSIIDKYLGPDIADKDSIKRQNIVKKELKLLRDKLFFGFFLINTMYVVLVYTLTEVNSNKDLLYFRIPCPSSSKVPYMDINPISIVFSLTFGIILVFQFFGMLYHRFSTFAQIFVLFFFENNKNKESKQSNGDKQKSKSPISDNQIKEKP